MLSGKINLQGFVFSVTKWKWCTIQGSSISQEAIVSNGGHLKGTLYLCFSYNAMGVKSKLLDQFWVQLVVIPRRHPPVFCLIVTESLSIFDVALSRVACIMNNV